MKNYYIVLILALLLISNPSWAFLTACGVVAEKAGTQYETKINLAASRVSPENMPESFNLTKIKKQGRWFIYQAENPWFDRDTCAKTELIDQKITNQGITKVYSFFPVIFNTRSANHAIVTGEFLIKVVDENRISELISQHGLVKIVQLSNPKMAVYQAPNETSYDILIEDLKLDANIEVFSLLLDEPRHRPR